MIDQILTTNQKKHSEQNGLFEYHVHSTKYGEYHQIYQFKKHVKKNNTFFSL